MQQKIKFTALLFPTLLIISLMNWPIFAQPQLTEQSKVFINGIGPIRVGMTVAEAEAAAKLQLVKKGGWDGTGGCYYLWPKTGPQNIGFMVISNRQDTQIIRSQDRIARVDIMKGSSISTLSGAKIGDTEAKIHALYPDKIEVTPHKYTGTKGHYLTFIPIDYPDKNFRVVFETFNGYVTQYRSGKMPEVGLVEGCS